MAILIEAENHILRLSEEADVEPIKHMSKAENHILRLSEEADVEPIKK